ncbi:MAG: hypothetical protein MK105_10300 [Crocinitomicaceae bacterium]|nr:hypothetical protein [Crocinitomicaceae bacterium]
MKFLILSVLLLSLATSCNKWKKDVNQYTYFGEDYSEADMSLLDVHSSDMQDLYVEMYNDIEDKNNRPETYKLFVVSNGEVYTETGSINSDWNTFISFTSTDGLTYSGEFQEDKGTYKLIYELDERTEEFTFVWRDTCKK